MRDKDKVIELLNTTPIVQVACQKAGISRATYYRWRDKDSKFKEKSDLAVNNGIELINDVAESQLVTLIKEKHPTSIYYWLNNHHPVYSERRLLLSLQEQQKLIEETTNFHREEAIQSVITAMIEGKLPKRVAGTLISIITKITRYKKNNEVHESVQQLRDLISSLRGVNSCQK